MREKELEIGITQIGTWKIEDGTVFKVFFGNYLTPHKNGEFQHLDYDQYFALLNNFLDTEIGKTYKVPSSADNANSMKIVLEKEKTAIKKLQIEKAKTEIKPKEEVPVYITEDIPQEFIKEPETTTKETEIPKVKVKKRPKEDQESEIKRYKKEAGILLIAVIFLTVVVAMQMLLNLYLLTR